MKNKEKILLKDQFFNEEKVKYLSLLIKWVYNDFSAKSFTKDILEKLPELELKQRIVAISIVLKKYLPEDYKKSVKILLKSLPEEKQIDTLDNDFGDFIFSSYWEFVSRFWCKKKYLHFSLNALEKITTRFSAEDSIRYFLNEFEEETFSKMLKWSKSDNYHVRRLASEGTRPKLPWSKKINIDYKKTIQILDNLYIDNSRYVTRSIANHLNDISKIDGALVLDTLNRWKKTIIFLKNKALNEENDLKYIISHSTRSLVKFWDKKTLKFLWYNLNPNIRINDFQFKNKNINIWDTLEFDLELEVKEKQKLVIDYKINFPLKNGKFWEKVFKIRKFKWKKWEILNISKKHPLKKMTTKKLFTWTHYLWIQVNWISYLKEKFHLQT